MPISITAAAADPAGVSGKNVSRGGSPRSGRGLAVARLRSVPGPAAQRARRRVAPHVACAAWLPGPGG